MSACALAAGRREPEYHEIAKRYTKEELSQFSEALAALTFEMGHNEFQDFLGKHYLEIASPKTLEVRGEFYTPEAVAEIVARITLDVDRIIEEGNPVRISEPACGAGQLILSTAKLFSPIHHDQSYIDLLRFTATDVSKTACDCTFINTSMWGIPAQIVHGNTLTLEEYGHYPNVHYFRVGEYDYQKWIRLFQAVDELQNLSSKPEPDFTLPDDPLDLNNLEQMDLFDDE